MEKAGWHRGFRFAGIEFCAFESGWWLKAFGRAVVFYTPSARAYFSERTGISKPLWKGWGYRLFVGPA